MSSSSHVDFSKDDNIHVQIQPDESNNNNTDMIATQHQHLHSTLYQLLHTAVGGIGEDDERTLYFEDRLTYISTEDGQKLMVE